MRHLLMAGFVLLGFTAMPRDARAQAARAALIAPSPETLAETAQLRLTPSQPAGLVAPAGERLLQGSRGNRRQGEILMIVGAAGIVTGLLVDEDLVTIAGAAVGGFGLYLYLEATR
jgi:hypothetical protein